MTIDEAIAQEREKAKEIRENIIDGDNLEPYESYCNTMVAKSAEKYEQIAEWLEELQMYKSLSPRELVSEKQKNDRAIEYSKGFEYGFKTGYNKAIDDFVNACKEDILCQTFGLHIKGIERIAEQLKAGGTKHYRL